MKENFKKIYDQMGKVEALTFGEDGRESIDKELYTLEPEKLFPVFTALNLPNNKMKDFVKKQYIKVLESKKKRVSEKPLQNKRKTQDVEIRSNKLSEAPKSGQDPFAQTETPGGVLELISKKENQPKESYLSQKE